jgi:hypothetical protein
MRSQDHGDAKGVLARVVGVAAEARRVVGKAAAFAHEQ